MTADWRSTYMPEVVVGEASVASCIYEITTRLNFTTSLLATVDVFSL